MNIKHLGKFLIQYQLKGYIFPAIILIFIIAFFVNYLTLYWIFLIVQFENRDIFELYPCCQKQIINKDRKHLR